MGHGLDSLPPCPPLTPALSPPGRGRSESQLRLADPPAQQLADLDHHLADVLVLAPAQPAATRTPAASTSGACSGARRRPASIAAALAPLRALASNSASWKSSAASCRRLMTTKRWLRKLVAVRQQPRQQIVGLGQDDHIVHVGLHVRLAITSWDNLWLAFHGGQGQTPRRVGGRIRTPGRRPIGPVATGTARASLRPGRYHHFLIHEPKQRKISAAPFRDRVAHHALCNLIEPVFDRGSLTTATPTASARARTARWTACTPSRAGIVTSCAATSCSIFRPWITRCCGTRSHA